MSRYLALGIALALALLVGAYAYKEYAATKQADRELQLLRHQVAVTDTLYRTDTLYFTRTLKVEVARRDTVLKHLTDTVLVKQFVYAADTALHACTAVIKTCEQRVAERDSIIKVYQAMKPSRFSVGLYGVCGVGVKGMDCVAGVGGGIALFR